MDESPIKAEGRSARHRAGYKSWKKKYRKMRIVFDQKMHDGEELHKQEAKAAALVKRLAIENDRLLDLLVEVNNSPQIPPEKRIDVALRPSSDPKAVVLPLDRDYATRKVAAAKKLEDLLAVPHSSYSQAKDVLPGIVNDLKAPEGETHPTDFLSGDDIDNYVYELDAIVDPDTHIPTLAPVAHPENQALTNPHLKNPTSVTNWLRKHAPKIFLQDGETHGEGEDAEAGGHTGGRKTRAGRGERGGRGGTRGKRASTAARLSAAAERGGDSMDEDADFAVTPVARGKRKRDDDLGYKPRGSSTRPIKKKRKSEADGPSSVRKSKKDAASAAAAAAAAAAASHHE